jgi:hypothetical protein
METLRSDINFITGQAVLYPAIYSAAGSGGGIVTLLVQIDKPARSYS